MNIIPGRIFSDINGKEYLVEKQIGSGGFANVFKIIDINNKNNIYALKTLLTSFGDEMILKSFKNEINLSREIESENVIKYLVTNDGEIDKRYYPYIVMEYANGGTLEEYIQSHIKESKFLTNDELRNLFSQLINGMKAINSKVVHRDIKPENILIKDNILKISDFGLAKVANNKTRVSTFKGYGTAIYVAPEGWNNDNNTIQMDIYSMGVVFYKLATLALPYQIKENSSIEEIRMAHLYENPINPMDINTMLSPDISAIILKMLEKPISKRFSSWDEIEEYLMKNVDKKESFNGVIDMMIASRVKKDNQESKKTLENERKKKEELEFCKLVKYQFKNDIYTPVKECIDEFNSRYPNKNIKITEFNIHSSSNQINIDIQLISREYITIKLVPILEDDFIRKRKVSDYYDTRTISEVRIPELRRRKVKAWGGLYTSHNTGFNIVLLENKDDIYGKWYVLENKCSPFYQKERREPFAFNINELEKEIQYVDAIHIYNTEVSEFSIEKIIQYIYMLN